MSRIEVTPGMFSQAEQKKSLKAPIVMAIVTLFTFVFFAILSLYSNYSNHSNPSNHSKHLLIVLLKKILPTIVSHLFQIVSRFATHILPPTNKNSGIASNIPQN